MLVAMCQLHSQYVCAGGRESCVCNKQLHFDSDTIWLPLSKFAGHVLVVTS